jgi:perosamine synthetase
MDAIVELATARGIAVIEDAAEAIGSESRGRRAGSFGLASAFSFHGSKTLTTGEGGMLVTDDEPLYRRWLRLRDHGRAEGGKMFWNVEVAYKYKLSGMQAALGLAQLERIDELIARKREIFGWYQTALEGFEGITLNSEAATIRNTYWMVTAIIDERFGLGKEELIAALGQEGIDSRPFFYPLSSLPAYASWPQAQGARSRNRIAYSISPRGVNLPSALSLTQEKVRYVCDRLRRILARQLAA